jgi:tRNA (guanine37-N1)-methyltransferase
MVFHILTLFRPFFEGPFACGIVARAQSTGRIEIRFHELRDFTFDRHRTVDDRPFGGDEGMVLKIEPVFLALEKIRAGWAERKVENARTVLLSAQGRMFDQAAARRFAGYDEVALLCGRYEGVDERVAEHLVDEEVSIGNFVLSGGEWACGVVVDCVTRLLPGVLGNEASSRRESFEGGEESVGILDFPHYTRPAKFREWEVPPVLLSGNHEEIRRWRRRAALGKTLKNRPELLRADLLSEEDREMLRELSPEARATLERLS